MSYFLEEKFLEAQSKLPFDDRGTFRIQTSIMALIYEKSNWFNYHCIKNVRIRGFAGKYGSERLRIQALFTQSISAS